MDEQQFNRGVAAAKRGEYTTAFRELHPLAYRGMAKAQYVLGMMCEQGKGRARDPVRASEWYRLAAIQGHAAARQKIDKLNRAEDARRQIDERDNTGVPTNVTRFEQLMYLSLGIGIVVSALQYEDFVRKAVIHWGPDLPAFLLGGVLGTGVGFGALVLLIWLIARRRKSWARWVYLVLFLIGLPLSIPILGVMLKSNPISAILSIIQVLSQGLALYLIFTGDSANWFKKVA